MGCTISGVILAGGASKRFGGITKSNVVLRGERIISRIINSINDIFDEIIIVTNDPSEFREFTTCKIIGDHYQKAGPLGGIHSALKSSAHDAIFVFAGDMPFLKKEIIAEQINQFCLNDYDIMIPLIGEFIEPLHSIYRVTVLDDLERFLTGGKNRSVRDFIKLLNVGYLQIEESEENKRAFTNINSQSDISEVS
jgi:molybdopterin-guanine dinucleotide biosynthesis protein A